MVWVNPSRGGRLGASAGPAAGAQAPNLNDEFLGRKRRPPSCVGQRLGERGIRNLLNGTASAADQMVVRVVGASELIVEGPLDQLNPAEDPATLEERQSPINRGPGEPAPLPLQAEPERFRVKVARGLHDRLDDHLAGPGRPKPVRRQEVGPAPQGAGGLTRIGCG